MNGESCDGDSLRGCNVIHCCVSNNSSNSILNYVFDGTTGTVTDLSSSITGIFGSSTNFYLGT